jgi:DNA-directed RNA polymerase specialized sigma24 family protein
MDPDRDVAAQKYETIRAGLIRIFAAKGFSRAEDMADEALRRASERLPQNYVGERAHYFRGFVPYLIKEGYRPKEIATDEIPEPVSRTINHTDEYECLLRCLQFLTPAKRELILDYHVYQGHDKIEQHEVMAQELAISKGALRLRAHHIRSELEECVAGCVKNLRHETKTVPGSIVNSSAGTRSINHGRGRTTKT